MDNILKFELATLITNKAGEDAVREMVEAADLCASMDGSAHENTDAAKIDQLASMSRLAYERARKEKAKELGVRAPALDALVKAARPGGEGVSKDIFSDVEPWPDAVDGMALLGEIEATIKRFLVCGVFAPVALSLWIAATWLADAFHVAPILNIVSPELRCGKTTCLDIVSRLVRRSMTTSNISPPAMFRSIEKFQPTLIIDEADAFFSENEDLRGIINSGHTRPTAYVIRTVGDDHEPKKFTTWAFKAIAGIGKRAATIEDRSIGVAAAARPALPESLNDRQQDNWEPLLAIAAVAGGSWPERARIAAQGRSCIARRAVTKASLKISSQPFSSQPFSSWFFSSNTSRMSMSSCIWVDSSAGASLAAVDRSGIVQRPASELSRQRFEELHLCIAKALDLLVGEFSLEGECNKGKALTQNKLARMLKPYGVATKTLRKGAGKAKGYECKDFTDAFNRYIPHSQPRHRAH